MTEYYPLFINGQFKDTAKRAKIINPATAELIAEAAVADKKDAELAIASSRAAFDSGKWPGSSLDERKGYLLKINQGILDHAEELAKLEALNTGKPIKETTFMDIPSAAKSYECMAHNLEGYLKGEDLVLENATANLRRQPQGVVLLIVPWNYPLLIASWKLASALAAGNTVILKPSSLTPLSAMALSRIIREAGLPDGVVNVLNGSGQELGEFLCSDKRLDMVSFTGGNKVGRQILQYSSKYVKRLTLELGGKSASVVLDDADLELAVNGSLCSIFLNQGQMCTAMSRIFVQERLYDDFLAEFVDKAKRIKLGDPMSHETQMGPLISEAQRKKVIAFVHQAQREGAGLACGGKIPGAPELKRGFFLEPAVFTDVRPTMRIFKDEVFGPVACVSKFSSIDEAVELANDTDFGLAACVWSADKERAQNIALRIDAGTVWINTYGMFYNQAPYGGFKQSGFGKELGREGFLEYTRLKNIITDQTDGAKPIVNYWYGF